MQNLSDIPHILAIAENCDKSISEAIKQRMGNY
jgi:hypothetical protein